MLQGIKSILRQGKTIMPNFVLSVQGDYMFTAAERGFSSEEITSEHLIAAKNANHHVFSILPNLM
jgi:hypothetical protein